MTAPASYQLHTGDWVERLQALPTGCAQVIATSPPYWSLRDYGVDGQLGLEQSVAEWCDKLVIGFREAKRVLRVDGLLWVNLGDSFAQGARGEDYTAALRGADGLYGRVPTQREQSGPRGLDGTRVGRRESRAAQSVMKSSTGAPDGATWGPGEFPARLSSHGLSGHGCKEKDLVGQPWMFAFAMRADGWWLRMDCVWQKANPMPESVDDRPTKSHEYVFLFSPSGNPTFWTHRDRGGTRVQPEPDYIFRHRATKEEKIVEPEPEYVWVHKRTGEVRKVEGDMGLLEDAISPEWRKLNLWRRVNLWEGRDYWYDADAVREPYKPETIARRAYGDLTGHVGQRRGEHQPKTTSAGAAAASPRGTHPDGGKIRERALYGPNQNGRNKRSVWADVDNDEAFVAAALELIAARHELSSVWDIPTPRFAESHFATFPPDLVKPCIFASTSEAGACEKCGAALRRVIEKAEQDEEWAKSMGANKGGGYTGQAKKDYAGARAQNASDVKRRILDGAKRKKTVAWRPTCNCWDCAKCGGWGYAREDSARQPCEPCGGRGFDAPRTVPCVVLDPFSGSGTTGVVALTYGRSYIGIELNPGKGSQSTAEARLAALAKQPGLPFAYAEGGGK